jgi:magnesium transporter
MFSVFVPAESSLKKVASVDLSALPQSAVWIDMVKPTAAEDQAVEGLAGIAVQTRETCRRSRFPAGSMSRTAPAT